MHHAAWRWAALAALALAACGGDEAQRLDAVAPEVPFVDQIDPAGRDATYDGTQNCGPALLAGIAKARGQTGGLSDAALVVLLAQIAGTTGEGTSGHGMIAGLQSMGMQTAANPGPDLGWVDAELAAGRDVIANGDYYAIPGRAKPGVHAGHYIAVTGAGDGWTAYRVTDPADARVTVLTDAQLANFIASHPEGGFTISAW